MADQAKFRATLESSMSLLASVEYIDLFGFHGINRAEQIDWIVKPGGCLDVIKEYVAAGEEPPRSRVRDADRLAPLIARRANAKTNS